MAIIVGHPPGPERTRALVEEIAGGARGAQLRTQVAAAKPGATREQIEEAFQEACLKAERCCRGQTEGEVYTWLRRTTDSAVDDMREHLKREVLVDFCPELEAVDPSLAPPDEVLIKREERAEIDHLTLAIIDRLAERERKIAVLHIHGHTRKEIASHLGLTPRVVKRSVEEILATAREQLVRLVGLGCADGHALVARYAFKLTSTRDAGRAQSHLTGCPRCGAMFEGLDLWRERAAALLPVPPAVEAHAHIVERVVHAGADVASSGQSPTETVGGLRRHVADAAAQLREHATAAYYRTIDPTPLAGARPGAVATAIAGCLALGGGATYCVQQGTDPITGLGSLVSPSHDKKPKPNRKPKRAHAAQALAPPVVTPTVAPPPTPPPPPQPPATTAAPPLPPDPVDEWEPTSPVGDGSSAAPPVSPRPAKPAPAPADGPGEFTGP